ncbi:Mu transposase C-terminal domain-containing protein [Pseudanabaena sp. PCC 6802]|uniref:Mu transposase C-terminal domain-containing protein n=1 Tax=Pseudanabaena sp. PCC 6802 TaxID=118173 RepID=UPI00034A7442|nr:Mu transposase C-terminal domain-containing protein [Pseudanabaena sp. PCC 6802]
MKGYFSSLELAGLIGLPSTDRRVRERAIRESWRSRDRIGRGGGKEYQLPDRYWTPEFEEAARARFPDKFAGDDSLLEVSLQAPIATPPAVAPEFPKSDNVVGFEIEPPDPKASKKDRTAEARYEILKAYDRAEQTGFCKLEGLSRLRCEENFAVKYNNGEVELPQWIRTQEPKLSRSTLKNWQKRLETEGFEGLKPKNRGRAGKVIDTEEELRNFTLGMVAKYPHCRAVQIHEAMHARFADSALPSVSTVARWVRDWKRTNAQLFAAVSNPDKFKSKHMAAFGSYSEGIDRLNQLWQLDSTPADVMCADGRYHLVAVVDVFSRRAMLLVTKTSRSVAILALLRRAILAWGVPEAIKTDNGKDYTSRHITRVLDDLRIERDLCAPFSPWQKPYVERFFRTFSSGLLELLPGYTGHNVADRQELRAQKSFSERLYQKDGVVEVGMTSEQLQSFADRWCDKYHHEAKTAHGGKTPFEIYTGSQGAIRTVSDERLLDVLMAEGGTRTVQKRGVQIEGGWFIAVELEAYIGQPVQARLDPADLGRIYIYDGDGKFICVAENPERTGMDRAKTAVVAKRKQKERIQAGKKALKALAKKANVGDVVDEMLSAAERRNGKLTSLPKSSEEYAAEALHEAARTLEALAPVPEPHYDEGARARHVAFLQEPERKPSQDIVEGKPELRKVFRAWKKGLPCDEADRGMARLCLRWAEGRALARFHCDDDRQEEEYAAFIEWLGATEIIQQKAV